MDDLISRQVVMDYIHRILNQGTGKKKSLEFIQKYVTNMPSVKPQERIGHWIVHEHAEEFYGRVVDNYECDNCGDWYLNKTNFCPNCGAKMEVEQND